MDGLEEKWNAVHIYSFIAENEKLMKVSREGGSKLLKMGPVNCTVGLIAGLEQPCKTM